jgi:hypothetical protein
LYGHPGAGALWESFLTTILIALVWTKVAEWTGLDIHPHGSVLIVYVDDIMMLATLEMTSKH